MMDRLKMTVCYLIVVGKGNRLKWAIGQSEYFLSAKVKSKAKLNNTTEESYYDRKMNLAIGQLGYHSDEERKKWDLNSKQGENVNKQLKHLPNLYGDKNRKKPSSTRFSK